MNCPRCQCETFKVRVLKMQMIKSGRRFWEEVSVALTCSKCGHNIKGYILREDVKQIRHRLESIESVVDEIHDDFRTVIEIYKEKPKEEKKRFWQRR